ncbi:MULTISPECIES: hypothetical protein [Celeribacter]|jgi:hypothetical protein|uniref:Uncharacterized protein n=1 Tax=Celeribacter halophilus TaxID=576117 RepID=A0A1I3VWT4_9RHOB|nr:hypothetical protein [Celeribacter halophilus]MBU2888708.1 hypothetical protein [Celeribacter halophilus]MDO6455916.1 hypothetical protein [Celeribacter halophilus]MDO6508938.1 hypothetical protein [Celeribacter halophilus]MDO6722104.1 hypothetical protein [Celeribacter halophilus]PZX06889.1 hypothetical protein LX82_03249 [Celeribacter halophilus]
MAFEALKAQVYMTLNEIAARPEDRHILQETLREKLSELRALGLPLPEDLVRLEAELEEGAADGIYPKRP